MKLMDRSEYMMVENEISKAEAVTSALEDTLIDIIVLPEYTKKVNKALNLVYTLMDLIGNTSVNVEAMKDVEVAK